MTGTPLQPTLKAASTAQHSQLSAVASSTPTASRAASPARPRKSQKQETPNNDYLSDKATWSLIRRVLQPETHSSDGGNTAPADAQRPPLTSSNDVDVHLYAIIAIVVKDFVQPWYTRITPDQAFVEEVVHIIAHCTRALEQRLRHVDIAELVLDEIPALFEQHVKDYQTAIVASGTLPYGKQVHDVYHALNPHPALDPSLSSEERSANERAYRQLLIQGALAVLLPTEDLQNSSLRILVTDIIADLILGRAIDDRLCQGWFLHEVVSKVTTIISRKTHPVITGEEIQAGARSRLEKFGLLSNQDAPTQSHLRPSRQSFIIFWFWAVLQWLFTGVMAVKFVVLGLLHARHLPARHRSFPGASKPSSILQNDNQATLVLDYRVFSTTSTLLDLSSRMPWLTGFLSICQHVLTSSHRPLKGAGSTLDRFLHRTITTHLLPPSLLPIILLNLRATIFPQNSLGPPAPSPPTQEQARKTRKTAAEDVSRLIPSPAVRILFAVDGNSQAVEQIEQILDTVGDARLNKYWIFGLLELIVVRLCPELLEKGPAALLEERGVTLEGTEEGDEAESVAETASTVASTGKLEIEQTPARKNGQRRKGKDQGTATKLGDGAEGESGNEKTEIQHKKKAEQRLWLMTTNGS